MSAGTVQKKRSPVIFIDNARCEFCGTCVAVCEWDAIELMESVIKVDAGRCTLCRCCVDVCPLGIPEVTL